MFPNQFHTKKMKNEVAGSLVTRSASLDDPNLDLDTLSMGMEERLEAMTFSLRRWKMRFSIKGYETLTLKRVLGFTIRLK